MNTDVFQEYLRDELLKRCRKNPQYSLRAFAASLGTNHAILSMILRGKRKATPAIIVQLGSALGLSPTQLQKFILRAESGNNSTGGAPALTRSQKIREMNRLTLDAFHLVAEWYHDAIMELSRVDGFNPTAKAISTTLGIPVIEAKSAIERLERLGLIEIQSDGKWKEVEDFSTIESTDLTSAGLRAFQKKILELSIEAVNRVPKELRDHTCITAAIRKSDLAEAKEKIKIFRRELMAFLQRPDAGTYDDVYCVQMSLFPLTNHHKKEMKKLKT